ncbi:protein DEHYDRATION-INDUCED 19 homolog 6-like [Phoenix dactylifera]|uniref:Protein DEHYDRATION-INDUCED 19 homolog 6-like n=1 Tax=Phoenix dactylifera TaxID=42345 RepID=A0A8B9ATJ1_PHODC|nr:protein DEHYDRATION-INDUCED 19 homolog 6-like [Phoenix dactylifera]
MDVEELSGFRLPSGWHRSSSAMESSSLHSGRDDDTWEYFPCPFCYVDVQILSLCNHLQEEHCFDMKNMVCPVCAANPGKDMIEHFIVQHSQLLKRRKSQKTSVWTNNSSMVEKEPYDVCSFQVASANCQGEAPPDSAPDPLLLSFICSITSPNMNSPEEDSADVGPTSLHGQSLEPSISHEVLEQDYEEQIQRAEFVQQMLISTIF